MLFHSGLRVGDKPKVFLIQKVVFWLYKLFKGAKRGLSQIDVNCLNRDKLSLYLPKIVSRRAFRSLYLDFRKSPKSNYILKISILGASTIITQLEFFTVGQNFHYKEVTQSLETRQVRSRKFRKCRRKVS